MLHTPYARFLSLLLIFAFAVAARADVLISEIMYHPQSENPLEEYIELHNPDAASVSVAGWQFTNGVTFTVPAATTIPAGGYLVVAANSAAFSAKYPTVTNFVAGWVGQLSNSANTVTLKDALLVTRDSVNYADDGDWATRRKAAVLDQGYRGWTWFSAADGGGKSLELIQAAHDNSRGQNWGDSATAEGTPGVANSIAVANIAPFILEVEHFPLLPTSTDVVTVNAKLADELTTGLTATLYYKLDAAGSFTALPMFDDGAHADGLAGDGRYGAQIPAQADDAIVEFYVEASDAAANARTWPKAALEYDTGTLTHFPAQIANCLYQVDNTVYAGAMPIYRMILKEVDRATLATINDTAGGTGGSHAKMSMTWITRDGTGTELRYNCFARNRGHGSGSHDPQSFHVGFPNDTDWKGQTGLNLNSDYTYLQLVGSALMRSAELPCFDSRQVQVRINGIDLPAVVGGTTGGDSYFFYVANESADTNFADHHFPLDSSGNIYSIRRSDVTSQEGDLAYLGADPNLYRPVYFKDTNVSEDNWSDLINFTQALANGVSTTMTNVSYTPDAATYAADIASKLDVAQFMKWFATQNLLGNNETSIIGGYGDDFNVYFGKTDIRAKLLPHDLDTILGHGDSPYPATDSIFQMMSYHGGGTTPTQMNAFIRHPDFAPQFFQAHLDLMNGNLSQAKFNALVDHILKGVVSETIIADRKTWYASRLAYVQSVIPVTISGIVASTNGGTALTTVSGYPQSLAATFRLTGRAHAGKTRSVKVNGVAATWNAFTTTWSLSSIPLTPGINRLHVTSFDGANVEFENADFDVWYEDGGTTAVAGPIATNVTWTAAGGPYVIAADLNVNAGGTINIEAGTTVYLGNGVDIIVATGGRILAEGTEVNPIRFTRAPGTTNTWPGFDINGAVGSSMSVFRHCIFEHASSYAIDVNAGNVEIDNCYFNPNCVDYLSLDGASFLVSNCIFPTGGTIGEVVHGAGGVRIDGRGIVRDCYFGYSIGYNDVFDFTGGQRTGPILQFINNVCAGGDDDILDLDGTDAWIEGNILMNTHRIGTPDSASAVSGGDNGSDVSNVTIIGNLIYDVDQACTGKQGNFYTFINNTVVDQNGRNSDETEEYHATNDPQFLVGVYNFADDGTTYGAGMYAEGNIIHSAERLMRNYIPANSTVTWNNNIFPPGITWTGPGSGNVSVDPKLNDVFVNTLTGASNIPIPTPANFRYLAPRIRAQFGLQTCSPARGTGPNGSDKGGVRPFGVSVSGAPTGTTSATAATITVGTLVTGNGIPATAVSFPLGSGWTHYKYRLNGGAWSAETPIADPIALTGLANGPQTLDVVGKNDAFFYQDDAAFGPTGTTTTRTWTVDTAYVPPTPAPIVRISEVLASNTETINFGTAFPDIIELTNVGNGTADLSGWGLTDNAALPFKYTIANGTTLAPGAHLVIYASGSGSVPAPKTGFGLGATGDDLTLTRSVAAGGGIADSVIWGQQLPDRSIGRCIDGSWDLCVPTFGSANINAPQSQASAVRINEWLAEAVTLFANDFVELHNPGQNPVNIGGHFLTDNPAEWPNRSAIRQLTFISAGGFLSFKADGDTSQGPDHVDFKLSALQGELGFMSPTLDALDVVIYGPQRTDISQGRSPDGALNVATFPQPSPGAPNPFDNSSISTNTVVVPNVITAGGTWSYFVHASAAPANDGSGRDFTHALYDDSAWPTAAGCFYIEPSAFPANTDGFAKTTLLTGFTATRPYQTYYFRKHFTYDGALPSANTTIELRGRVICDDGAVFYLNGQPLTPRLRVAGTGIASFSTRASLAPEVTYENIVLDATGLVNGDNVLTVSVHQADTQSAGAGSSDITWGMKLDIAAITTSALLSVPVVINEVLPVNVSYQNPDNSFSGWIELINNGTDAYDLSDFSLSDAIGTPRKFIFAPGTTIAANGRLVLYCNPLAAVSASNTAFNLSAAGDQIFLFKSLALGGGLSDSIVFGQQLPDLSLARIPDGTGAFALAMPTRDAINSAAATTAATSVKLNEWLAAPVTPAPTWLELYNTAATPVLLSGNYLTDSFGNKTKHLIPPHTYLGGSGSSRWLQLIADNDSSATANHVNFTIENGEGLWLFTNAGTQLDGVAVNAQPIGTSQGRFADGSATIVALTPTPGTANQVPNLDTDGDGMPDAYELANGLNPNDANDATQDADADGQSNKAEYLAGTNPQFPGSKLAATVAATGTPGQFAVTFIAIAGKTYTVRYKDDLTSASWTNLQQIAAPSVDTVTTVNDTPGVPKRFYQIVTPQQ